MREITAVSFVDESGKIDYVGRTVDDAAGVRPAMWIDLGAVK